MTAVELRIAARRASVPQILYPEQLPISARRDDLLTAIRDHQVVIVAGETGSGKSTQLPKMCLDVGRGVLGMIGHTQPRRVAARTIAERVAEELNTELGDLVGYAVRFTDRVTDATLIKVMTDGILLAEMQRDRLLSRYDTLIIDEAHERSLNIDFLLGYLKQLLVRRPDLKLIVTSATIDTGKFSDHFSAAPIIEVTGRMFAVETRYRPIGDDSDQVQAICAAVGELRHEGPGDVLVFLSGEREIRDTADALRRLDQRHTEILPLYARLSAHEQHRIFQPHSGTRIVLSTNVAETSLTVPGVRYVVDTGSVRMSRYSHRLKVQRLPIEPVSQASANQRSGRCGRVAAGICIRLYSEDEFAARDEFTEPEILRTNLASVILQMTALGLGDVAAFPFIEPPDARAVRDGIAVLEELGAIEPGVPADPRRLTPLGRRLARLPLDPRLGRMVLEAERHGCVREVMVIASLLSIQDPRERPTDKQQAADESHARFKVEGSDFLSMVALWDYLRIQQRELSSSQFRKLCRNEFFNYLRVREWHDLFSQLRQVTGTLGIHPGTAAGHPDHVHQSLLAGLLSNLGLRDGESREFKGARGSKFLIAPGSVVAKKSPRWVMAAELVETNRLWGRVAAGIQPEWAERLAGPLAKKSYGEATWDARGGRAVTTERVALYGLPIVSGRQIGLDRIDQPLARAMFIRHALVGGQWTTRHAFVRTNQTFLDHVKSMEDRLRRVDIVDDDVLAAFFDTRVAPEVVSTRHFDQWWKRERHQRPDLLHFTLDALVRSGSRPVTADDFPSEWCQDDLVLPLTYRFDPGDSGDGVTVHIPLAVLNRLDSAGFDWQVPGFRGDLIVALAWTLPKTVRRNLVPVGDSASIAAGRIASGAALKDSSLVAALAAELSILAGERVTADLFAPTKIAPHLQISFSVEDEAGLVVASGKDLDAIRQQLGGQIRAAIAETTSGIERTGLTTWDFDPLPRVVENERDGHLVRGYPALVDDGQSVSIRVFSKPAIQDKIMPGGVRRLLLLSVPIARKAVGRELANDALLAIGQHPTLKLGALIDDCTLAAADLVISDGGEMPWDAVAFDELQRQARQRMFTIVTTSLGRAGKIVVAAATVEARLARLVTPSLAPSVADCRYHLERLVRPGFVTNAGVKRLDDVLRYVRGIERRAEKVTQDPRQDQRRVVEIRGLENLFQQLLDSLQPSAITSEILALGWMLEELRISMFAQVLGVAQPVSPQRIRREIARLSP